jgi:hypothetical protein
MFIVLVPVIYFVLNDMFGINFIQALILAGYIISFGIYLDALEFQKNRGR